MEMRMTNVLMLHGINHNMFGKRDPVQYGTITLAEIDARLKSLGADLGVQVESFQTNRKAAISVSISHLSTVRSVARRLIRSSDQAAFACNT
jgi:3-dehydroquinate dehydratase-2